MPSEEQHRTMLPVRWVRVLSCLWVGWTTGRAEQPTDPTGDVPLALVGMRPHPNPGDAGGSCSVGLV